MSRVRALALCCLAASAPVWAAEEAPLSALGAAKSACAKAGADCPALRGGQENDPPGVAEHEGGADVLMIEGVLEREHRGLMTFDEFRDFVVQLGETVGKGIVAAEAQHTAFDETSHSRSPIPRFDHAVARDLRAGVDAQDPHVIPSPPPSPPRLVRGR